MSKLVENLDYIIDKESGLMILTSYFLSKRGYCCGNKCLYCPYKPKWIKGNKKLEDKDLSKINT